VIGHNPNLKGVSMTGVLEIMGPEGDTKLEWSRGNEVEVEAARASFNLHKKKGYIAYKMGPGGGKGEVITTFDPEAERIIMAPPVQGG
jgi:hypothetical protein